MTVLVCIPCLLTGGTEIQTLSLVEALVAAGHNPVIACYFEYAKGMVRRYEAAGAEVPSAGDGLLRRVTVYQNYRSCEQKLAVHTALGLAPGGTLSWCRCPPGEEKAWSPRCWPARVKG